MHVKQAAMLKHAPDGGGDGGEGEEGTHVDLQPEKGDACYRGARMRD